MNAPQAPATMSKTQAWLLFLPIGFLTMMTGIDMLGAGLALTPMSREFSINLSHLQWFLTAFGIGNSAFLVTAGKCADRYGNKNILLIGLALFVLSSFAIAISPSYWLTIFMRFIQGAAGGTMITSGISILIQAHPAEKRTVWIGALIGTAGFGMAVGPIVGGLLIQYFSWRALFYINLPIGIIAFIIAICVIKSVKAGKQEKLDIAGILLFITTISLLTVTINQGQQWGWSSTGTLMVMGGTVITAVAFLILEMKIDQPLLHMSLFKTQNYMPGNLLCITLYFGLIAWIFCFSLYYQHVLNYSPVRTGMHLLPMAAMLLIGALLMPKITSLFSSTKNLLLASITINIIAFGLLSFSPLNEYNIVIVGFILLGTGFVITNANTMSISMQFLPQSLMGLGSGTAMMIRWLGGALGGAISGSLLVGATRHYMLNKIELATSAHHQQIMQFIKHGVLSGEHINSPFLNKIYHQAMMHSIHHIMLIITILYVINLIYAAVGLKIKT